MPITALPNPPSRSDPANFPERADAFMAALPTFAQEANLLQAQVNEAAQTADENADSARGSAQAAAQSSDQAGDKANDAISAADLAGQRATASTSAAALAAQWATKIGAPVSGDEFSAKHYAQQAAIGAGLPIYAANNVPQQNAGSIFIQGQGPAEWDTVTGRYRILSQIPVGSIDWWPLRASIPAGKIPLDGQTISRATFPDIAAMVVAGTLPVVAEGTWLNDPLQRGAYTLSDDSTTIRLPDLNGKSAGSIGAVFQRGDGALSAGTNGLIQRDAMQVISGSQSMAYGAVSGAGTGPFAGSRQQDGVTRSRGDYSFAGPQDTVRFDNTGVVRTAAENRALNVTGVWVVNAFGVVTNPGAMDAAQLASDLAVTQSLLEQARSQLYGFGQILRPRATAIQAWYQNTSTRPITVSAVFVGTGASNVVVAGYLNNSGNTAGMYSYDYRLTSGAGAGTRSTVTMLVPPGIWWMMDAVNMTVNASWEYS